LTRAGPNKKGNRHTSGSLLPEHGGTGNFKKDLESLAEPVRPSQPGDPATPRSLIGENGVFGRASNSSGDRPHETLHY